MSCMAMTQLHSFFYILFSHIYCSGAQFFKIFAEKCKFALTYARNSVKYCSANLFNRRKSYVQNLQYHVCHAA